MMAARLDDVRAFSFATVETVTDTKPKAHCEPLGVFEKRFERPVVRKTKQGQAYILANFSGRGRTDAAIESRI